jgi:NADH-quinone oxidoreductase subunit M
MFELPIVTFLLILPLFASLFEFIVRRNRNIAGKPALIISLIHLLTVLAILFRFPTGSAEFYYYEIYRWIPAFEIYYAVGIDGLNLPFLALISGFILLTNIWNLADKEKKQLAVFSLTMLLETAMVGAVVAQDLFLFGIFWELMLIPIFFMMVGHSSVKAFDNQDLEEGALTIGSFLTLQKRNKAAYGFLIFTMLGAALMFVAILYLAVKQESFLLSAVKDGLQLSDLEGKLLFLGFFIAFAVKIPIFPLHSWLPGAQREAPLTLGVIFAAVLFKMGIYGLVRFAIPLFPDAAQSLAPMLFLLSFLSIILGGLIALKQQDLKYLIAYSSISHLGFCLLGVALLSTDSLSASIFHSLAHGISAGGIFFIIGIIYERFGTRSINSYGGIGTIFPSLSGIFVLILLGYLAVPTTNGFIGEFTILYESFVKLGLVSLIPISGVVIGAVYGLLMTEKLFFGKCSFIEEEKLIGVATLRLLPKEVLILVPMVILTFYLGIFPESILSMIRPVIETTITARK